MRKKIIGLMVAAALCLGLFPAGALAAGEDWPPSGYSGSNEDYTIDGYLDDVPNKSLFEISDVILYSYEDGQASFFFRVREGYTLSTSVSEGPVTARIQTSGKLEDGTGYIVLISAAAGPRDYEAQRFRVNLQLEGPDARTIYISGKAAYSDTQQVTSGSRLMVRPSVRGDRSGNTGALFSFSEPVAEQAQVQCSDGLSLYFLGDYGQVTQNLRVVTDTIPDAASQLGTGNASFYRFIGNPAFSSDVTVFISGEAGSYLYSYDEAAKTLKQVEAIYQQQKQGWEFSARSLGTFIVSDKQVSQPDPDPDPLPDPDPDPAPNPGAGSGSSSSGNSGSGHGWWDERDAVERRAASSNASDNSRTGVGSVTRLAQEAVQSAGQAGNASVRMTNVNTIGRDALQAAKKAAGDKPLVFHFDQAKKGVVQSRLYINPALIPEQGEKKLNLKVTLNEGSVKKTFAKYYQNEIQTITFAQKGGFGGPVEIAAQLDLSRMNAKALCFYHYDAASNSFYRLPDMRYFVDTNGYLHIQGITNTDTLIVTDRPMEKR